MRKLRQWHNQFDYQPKELKKPAFSGFFIVFNYRNAILLQMIELVH